ncbi:MAG: Fic family protein [Actinomycetota bacterium]
MTEAEQAEFDRKVGRGLVAALFFVGEQINRWPTLEDLRHIHRLIFLEAHPDIGGEYRPDSYWPQYCRFAVPRWQDVPICMLRLEDLLQRAQQECDALADFNQQEKVLEWAARIHHRFECIHPFQDGNGRTGRALVSWMLGHYGLPEFDPWPEIKSDYLSALEAADAELTAQDLLHADYWPHQTAALQSLIDLIGDVLGASVNELVAELTPEVLPG